MKVPAMDGSWGEIFGDGLLRSFGGKLRVLWIRSAGCDAGIEADDN